MKKLNWINIRLIVVFGVIVFLYSFASVRNANRNLTASNVTFVEEKQIFIKQEMVNNMLIENKNDVKTIQKLDINLNKLEKSMNKNPMIEKSEVYVSIDGVLNAVVKQKTPIARIFDSSGSYYTDYLGNRMPLSDNCTARVPLISGEISKEYKDEFRKLLQFVYDDDFLKKNIIGIQIYTNGSLRMLNRDYGFVIDFGKCPNYESKFNNYKAFFQKADADKSLKKYKNINLIYSHQVVATK
jgi:cell division protein FtsQ